MRWKMLVWVVNGIRYSIQEFQTGSSRLSFENINF